MAIKKFRVVLDGIAHEVEVEELGSAVVSSVPAPVVAPAPAAAPAGRKLCGGCGPGVQLRRSRRLFGGADR